MSVTALLAANAMVLVTGLGSAADEGPAVEATEAADRPIVLITAPDGSQVAVDPTTPEGQQAIRDAVDRGDTVETVRFRDVPGDVDAPEVAATSGDEPADIPDDIERILGSKLDDLLTTATSIVNTGSSILEDTKTTVSSIAEDTKTTVSSIVEDTKTTVSSVVGSTQSTVTSVVGSTRSTVTSVVASVPTTVPTTTTAAPTTTTAAPTTTTTTNAPVVTVTTTTTIQVPSPGDLGSDLPPIGL